MNLVRGIVWLCVNYIAAVVLVSAVSWATGVEPTTNQVTLCMVAALGYRVFELEDRMRKKDGGA